MLRITPVLAALLLATPVAAEEGCIVDYDTFELRNIWETDPASMLAEQSINASDWGTDLEVVVAGDAYEKYGLSRELWIAEVGFYAWKDSVPFLREAGTTESPPAIVYALVDGPGCVFQPYQLKPS